MKKDKSGTEKQDARGSESLTFPAGHFYSPIPDVKVLRGEIFNDSFAGLITLNDREIFEIAGTVFSFAHELADRIQSGETRFEWCNSQFPPADALAYYGFLRLKKPSRIVEIGSGFSTLVAMEAIKANGHGAITCIEPFPRDFLRNSNGVTLRDSVLQTIEAEVFSSLAAGDVLFIDSSHQVKCQSDVLDIFFRVLELLRPGVFVHFHDIFLPDDYPKFWLEERGIFFNEQYFLLAYLKDNPRYRYLLPNAYLARKHRAKFESWLSGIHQPSDECFVNQTHDFIKAGSFWMEKTR